MTRMQGARAAVRSLDVQTYIWHADITGIFLAEQLLESADRGVKVRPLLDDMDARARTWVLRRSLFTQTSTCGCSIRSDRAVERCA